MLGLFQGKRCCTCKKHKDLSEFGRDAKRKDGKKPNCKECTNVAVKKSQAKRKQLGKCQKCDSPRLDNSTFCLWHLIGNRVKAGANEGQSEPRRCKNITDQMIDQYLANWINQGGQLDGTGAKCWRSGKPISFLNNTAQIGHRQTTKKFSNGCDFNDPSNVAFEHAQYNLENMGHGGEVKGDQYWVGMGTRAQRPVTGKAIGGSQLGRTLEAIYLSQPIWLCPYYPDIQLTPATMSLDHIIPTSRGGTNSLDNLQFVSRMANQQKGNLSHQEYCRKFKLKASPNPLSQYASQSY